MTPTQHTWPKMPGRLTWWLIWHIEPISQRVKKCLKIVQKMRKKSGKKRHNATREKKRQKQRFQKINGFDIQKNEYDKGFICYEDQIRNFQQYNRAHRKFLKNTTKNSVITNTKRDIVNSLKDICCSECSKKSQTLTSQLINSTDRLQKIKIATKICTLFKIPDDDRRARDNLKNILTHQLKLSKETTMRTLTRKKCELDIKGSLFEHIKCTHGYDSARHPKTYETCVQSKSFFMELSKSHTNAKNLFESIRNSLEIRITECQKYFSIFIICDDQIGFTPAPYYRSVRLETCVFQIILEKQTAQINTAFPTYFHKTNGIYGCFCCKN